MCAASGRYAEHRAASHRLARSRLRRTGHRRPPVCSGGRREAIQVFVANPRRWAQAAGTGRRTRRRASMRCWAGLPVFVHAPYLINPGSPDLVISERSAAAIRHSLRRGSAIGARGVVVHTGSAVDGDRPACCAPETA